MLPLFLIKKNFFLSKIIFFLEFEKCTGIANLLALEVKIVKLGLKLLIRFLKVRILLIDFIKEYLL